MTPRDVLVAAILRFEAETDRLVLDAEAVELAVAGVRALLGNPLLDQEAKVAIGARSDALAVAVELVLALRQARGAFSSPAGPVHTDGKQVAELVTATRIFAQMTFGLNAGAVAPVDGEVFDPLLPDGRVAAAAIVLMGAIDRLAATGDTSIRIPPRTVH